MNAVFSLAQYLPSNLVTSLPVQPTAQWSVPFLSEMRAVEFQTIHLSPSAPPVCVDSILLVYLQYID